MLTSKSSEEKPEGADNWWEIQYVTTFESEKFWSHVEGIASSTIEQPQHFQHTAIHTQTMII